MQFSPIDVAIVVIYMLISTGIGSWIGRNQKNTTDYFLGARRIPWLAVTLSIVATETSVLTFISIPAVSYGGNMTFLQLTFGYVVGRVLVAILLIPAYFRGDITTAYHFLGERFGQKMRNTASITFMATRLLADGVRLFATAIPLAIIIKGSGLFQSFSDVDFYLISIVVIGLLTMVYTYIGGIRSVIWMDVVQLIIYIGGAILAAIMILHQLPHGLSSALDFSAADNKLRILNFGMHLSFHEFIRNPYTFFTALIGGAVFSLASHGTDQLIVQRILTCKNMKDSQKAIIWSGVIVVGQFFLFLLIGIFLFAFYHGASPEQLGLTRADGIFPKFIVESMPVGISGIIVAALFAAAMSTLSGSLSSLSNATMMDIYVPLAGHKKSEGELLKISRIVTLLWGVVLIGTAIAFIGIKGAVVEVALSIASYTYGGLLGSFLLGLFYKKAVQRDAIIGFFSALVVMIVVIQTVQIAWPLYTIVGSATAILTGILSNAVLAKK